MVEPPGQGPKLTPAVLDGLAASPLLRSLKRDELSRFLAHAEELHAPAENRLVAEGDLGRDLYFLLEGRARLSRGALLLREIGAGEHFGALSFFTNRPRSTSVISTTPVRMARLSWARWTELIADAPALSVAILQGVVELVRDELVARTDSVSSLLADRSLPRAREVKVRLGTDTQLVRTGTLMQELLPRELNGAPVVAGMLGQKPVSLKTPVVADAAISPLTLHHWEGRQVWTHSVGLLLLEAAHQVAPGVPVRLGASRGLSQVVELGSTQMSPARFASEVQSVMERLSRADVPIRTEYWTQEEAQSYFTDRAWHDAARILHSGRQATVPMCSCGTVYALAMGPLAPSTGMLHGFRLSADEEGVVLDYGAIDPRLPPGVRTLPLSPQHSEMAREHRRWLAATGVDSVGAFNELCINGQVAQLIRVAEGFHEKRIGRIADVIAAAKDRVRIIAIAGPSSSGKTTFIKRLTVQLQINGLNPVGISLDNYYVDRERTVRDEKGDYDFEALEALDLGLLQDHVRRMLSGEEVPTARYDFKTGLSHPAGGPRILLQRGDVLMMEGIHGLNPRLLGNIPGEGELFRIFIHPATTLPFDRLTRVSATDLRLLRRIVRDRHQRGYSAAENIVRWPSVVAGERQHIFPFQAQADAVFDSSLIYEPAVLKVYAERYLLECPSSHPAFPTAYRLRHLIDRFVSIYPDHVPPTSLIREFIGGSGFEY